MNRFVWVVSSGLSLALLTHCGGTVGDESNDGAAAGSEQAGLHGVESLRHHAFRGVGTLGIIEADFDEEPPSSEVAAEFAKQPRTDPRCKVQPQTSGACTFQICADGEPPKDVSGGKVTFMGGSGAPISLSPKSGSYPIPPPVDGLLWNAPEWMVVSTSGGVVPAFVHWQPFPNRLAFTAPDLTVPISLSSDLKVKWTPSGKAGDRTLASVNLLEVVSGSKGGPDEYVSLRCDFPQASGSGKIPRALLANFHTDEVDVEVAASTRETVSVGGFQVDAEALLVTGYGIGVGH